MLEVKNLALNLNKKPILKQINFALKKGEILCILGKNGSGKSSLLKCILGLWEYGGEVFLDGKNIADLDFKQRARKLAYVPQSCNIAFPFSLFEVVLMGRFSSALGFNYSKSDEKCALNALETLGIAHFSDKKFYSLSGGQKQLGLMARALVQNSEILVLDEPLSALDLGACAKILRLIKSLNKTIILTSHRPEQCFIAHKICLLKEGKILAFDDAKNALTVENINTLYGVESDFITLPDKSKYFYVK